MKKEEVDQRSGTFEDEELTTRTLAEDFNVDLHRWSQKASKWEGVVEIDGEYASE